MTDKLQSRRAELDAEAQGHMRDLQAAQQTVQAKTKRLIEIAAVIDEIDAMLKDAG